jgi:hypothetical protein
MSEKFVKSTLDDLEASKQTMSSVLDQIENGDYLFEQIKDTCAKTLLGLQPFLMHENEIYFSGSKGKMKGKCF